VEEFVDDELDSITSVGVYANVDVGGWVKFLPRYVTSEITLEGLGRQVYFRPLQKFQQAGV
jgi:hypothetical protein